MSTTEDQLNEYLRDPLSMPDFENLDALTDPEAKHGNDQPTDLKGDENGATPGASGEQGLKPEDNPGEKPADKAKPEGGEEGEPADLDPDASVVKSKSGKHEIPYSVLAKEREDRVRAEQAVRQLTEKIDLLQKAVNTGDRANTAAVSDLVDDDTLAQIEEESPTLAKTVKSLVERAKQLEIENEELRPQVQRNQIDNQVQAKLTVEDAIANVPKLLHVRTADPAAFNEIAGFDEALRTQPKWQGKPMQERFEAAVRMYEAANGEISLPGARKEPPASQKPAENPDAKVEAAIKKAEETAAGPHTLSDIPGGAPAASNDQDALGELSGVALTQRFLDMSPEQIEAELARLS